MAVLIRCLLVILVLFFSGCANVKPTPPDAVNGQSVEEWEKTLPASPQTAFRATSTSFTGWNKFWLSSAIVGQAADAVTTVNALSGDECKEANPILGGSPSTGAVVALKAVIFAGSVWLVEYHYSGHPRQQDYRNYIYGSLAVLGLGAAGWNASQDCQ